MHLAFLPTGGAKWTGGIHYLRNLLIALNHLEVHVDISLLCQEENKPVFASLTPYLQQFIDFSAVQAVPYHTSLKERWISRLTRRSPRLLKNAANHYKIDLIFGQNFTMVALNDVKYLGWIPDFQHLYLPELMTDKDITMRNAYFLDLAKHCSYVVLSSHAAMQDFARFAPEYKGKGVVVSFASFVPENVYDYDSSAICDKYSLPEKYFYIPNQFWQHKNHRLVFEALKVLKTKGIKPFIVCTGNTVDYRNPQYFSDLLTLISQWGLKDQVAILGMVPYDDVYQLMRQSICLINPSLFEGWSTTVEEAKSIGKQCLLSNIAVHEEQAPSQASYFQVNDVDDLANHMNILWKNTVPGPDVALELQARHTITQRMQDYGQRFYNVMQKVVE